MQVQKVVWIAVVDVVARAPLMSRSSLIALHYPGRELCIQRRGFGRDNSKLGRMSEVAIPEQRVLLALVGAAVILIVAEFGAREIKPWIVGG